MVWTPALAMGGAALALGPVIIHILFRRRFQVVDFAPMRFLLDSLKRNRQRLRLEELLIILLRVLVCLLIGLMLADIRAASIAPASARAATAHVFVLDDSLSMGQRVGDATLFTRATERLVEQLRGMADNDLVAIVSASSPDSGRPVGALVTAAQLRKEGVPARITAIKPTDLRANFPAAIAEATRIGTQQKDLLVRLYVISDFRKPDWNDGSQADALRGAFDGARSKRVDIVLLDYGVACPANLSLEKLEMVDRLAIANVESRFRATVRNTGTQASSPSHLQIHQGHDVLPAIPVPAIPPGQSFSKEFRYAMPAAGWASLKAALPSDSLPGDDQATLAVNVREAVRVLVVDGSAAAGTRGGASYRLVHALDPSGKGEFGQLVEVVSPQDLTEAGLDHADAVMLVNVRDFPGAGGEAGRLEYPQLKSLEAYVAAGGGLGIFVGDQANLEFYNNAFFADGAGLLPLSIQSLPVAGQTGAAFVRLRPDSIGEEPMLRIFTGQSQRFTSMVRFQGFARASANAAAQPGTNAGPVEILARFDDPASSPAAARRRFGQGNVIAWYTVPDGRWSDWHKDLTFLPVINDMVASLLRLDSPAHRGQVGEPFHMMLPAALRDATGIVLKTPAYPAEDPQSLRAHAPTTNASAGPRIIEYAATAHAGLYDIQFTLPDRTTRQVLFSRAIDPREADLARTDEKQLRAVAGADVEYHGDLANGAAGEEKAQPRSSFFPVLLMILLGTLALESLLARRFGHYAERSA